MLDQEVKNIDIDQMKDLNTYIQEKLVIDPEIIDKEKQSKAKLEKMTKDLCNAFPRPSGMWANGSRLNIITAKAKEIFGKTKIKINVPYHGFNCFGPANIIHKDVYGLIPFSKEPLEQSQTKTLFYGTEKVNGGKYIPFQAENEAFYIKSGEVKDNIPTFELEKYYESFI